MPATKRRGHEGRTLLWPWTDRGRSAVTPESVRADMEALRAMVKATAYSLVLDRLVRV